MNETTTQPWSYQIAALRFIDGSDKSFYYICKRILDVTIAATAIILASPVMLAIAILIRLDSPGPVFFVQNRVGSRRRRTKDGQVVWEIGNFQVYKFRSMVQNADESIHQAYIKSFVQGTITVSDSSKSKYKLTNDPRVTRVGAFLRKTSLDELPQLFNVIRGDMSLVGPRPVPEYEVAEYREAWRYERLGTLPGITGLWQVTGRCQVEFDDMIRLDLDYIRHQSVWLDLKILLKTIPAVLSGSGAE